MRNYHLPITNYLFLLLLLASAACSQLPLVNPFATRTPTPFVQCTPPPCASDETYACGAGPGNCPGGCGTICVKKTAEPSAATDTPTPEGGLTCALPACDANEVVTCPNGSCPGGCGTTCATVTPAAAGDAGCTIVVRTPPPEAPTAVNNGTPDPNKRVDPHIELCTGQRSVRAGNPVVILAQAVDIGLPIFMVLVRDAGAADPAPLVQVSYDNQVRVLDGHSQVLQYHAIQAQGNQVVVTLLAVAPGTAEVSLSATGEIHYGYPGPATWAGGGSEPLEITVTQ